jgi:ribosomal protection tetracycline resistance protein
VKKAGSWVQERQPDEGIFDWATVGPGIERPHLVPASATAWRSNWVPCPGRSTLRSRSRCAKRLLTGPHGWEVTDCRVAVTNTAFFPPASGAGHFRATAALAPDKAVRRGGTEICEPVNRFDLDIPTSSGARVLGRLVAHRAVPGEPQAGPSTWRLTGRSRSPASRRSSRKCAG